MPQAEWPGRHLPTVHGGQPGGAQTKASLQHHPTHTHITSLTPRVSTTKLQAFGLEHSMASQRTSQHFSSCPGLRLSLAPLPWFHPQAQRTQGLSSSRMASPAPCPLPLWSGSGRGVCPLCAAQGGGGCDGPPTFSYSCPCSVTHLHPRAEEKPAATEGTWQNAPTPWLLPAGPLPPPMYLALISAL